MKTVEGFHACQPVTHYFLDLRNGKDGTQHRIVSRASRIEAVIRPDHWQWIGSYDSDGRIVHNW